MRIKILALSILTLSAMACKKDNEYSLQFCYKALRKSEQSECNPRTGPFVQLGTFKNLDACNNAAEHVIKSGNGIGAVCVDNSGWANAVETPTDSNTGK